MYYSKFDTNLVNVVKIVALLASRTVKTCTFLLTLNIKNYTIPLTIEHIEGEENVVFHVESEEGVAFCVESEEEGVAFHVESQEWAFHVESEDGV